MATRKSLIASLANARERKSEKSAATKKIEAPVSAQPAKPIETEVITHPKRVLAKTCTDQAMIVGWDKAIQKTAYENGISEQQMREILDDALEYEDKADPAGRIDGLQDWAQEKRGSSALMAARPLN